MRKRVLIVDDEALARDRLQRLLEKHGAFDIRVATDGPSAIADMCRYPADIVFLDVQMPFMDGFQVIEKVGLAAMPTVVFVTAYDKYALRAFDTHGVDYLLKPYTEQRFCEALQKAIGTDPRALRTSLQELLSETRNGAPRYLERIMVRLKEEIVVLKVEDIDWIEAANNYVKIYSGRNSFLLRDGISALEAALNPEQFIRIHRSTIVNVNRVRTLRPWYSGDYILVLDSGKQLRLSRTHRHKFTAAMARPATTDAASA